jgi:hypothetical protein
LGRNLIGRSSSSRGEGATSVAHKPFHSFAMGRPTLERGRRKRAQRGAESGRSPPLDSRGERQFQIRPLVGCRSLMVAKALRPPVVRRPVLGSREGSEDKAGRNQRHRMSLDSRREKQSRFSSRAERRARLTHPTASSGGDEHRDQRVGDCENVDQHDPEYGLYDAAHLTAIGVTVDLGTPAHNREEHDQRSETLKERLE